MTVFEHVFERVARPDRLMSARAHLRCAVHTVRHVHGRVPVCTSVDEPVHGPPGGHGQDGPVTRHGSARGPGHRSAREVPAGDGHHAWAVAGPATEPPTQPLAVVTADGPGHERDAAREAGRDHHAPRNEHGHGREAARDHAPGNEHGHGHGPAAPAGRRVRVLLAVLLVPCALAALVGLVAPAAHRAAPQPPPAPAAAAGARPGDGRADHRLLPRRRAGPLRRARRRHVRRPAGRPRPGPDRAPRARNAAVHRR